MKNREIKFEYIFSNEDKSILKEVFTIEQIESGNVMDWFDDNPLLKDFKIIAKRQYTGLKDSKGKEIYEGDVFKVNELIGLTSITEELRLMNEKSFNAVISIHRCTIGFFSKEVFFSISNPFIEIEVIGNIYETLELLK